MKRHFRSAGRVVLAACVVVGAQELGRAGDPVADTVRVHLDNAKAVHEKARQRAAEAVRTACDNAIKVAGVEKQAAVAADLKAQEQAFSSTGVVPTAAAVKQAADEYREAIAVADANLERAYVRAVRRYADQGESEKALAVEREKATLRGQQPAAASTGPATRGVPDEAATGRSLAAARAQYRTDVGEARRTLVAQLEGKLNAATDAGQLRSAQELKAFEDSVKAGGAVSENATDPAVAAAAATYRRAVQSANVRMARAFSLAVHDLTRARQLDRAQAVQTEYVLTGLSGIDLAAVPGEGGAPTDTTYVLGRNLPEFLTTADRWDLHPRGGISLQRWTYVRSKSGNYLDRDFTCDLWFTTEGTGTNIFVGIGDGRGRPGLTVPANSLALSINSPDVDGGTVGFLKADGEVTPIGQLNAAGDYVARIEKTGKAVTFAVGDEDADGTFNAKLSTTVTDAAVLAPFITSHNAHLFFGGGRFWKVRYVNGKPPAVIPDAVVKSLAGN